MCGCRYIVGILCGRFLRSKQLFFFAKCCWGRRVGLPVHSLPLLQIVCIITRSCGRICCSRSFTLGRDFLKCCVSRTLFLLTSGDEWQKPLSVRRTWNKWSSGEVINVHMPSFVFRRRERGLRERETRWKQTSLLPYTPLILGVGGALMVGCDFRHNLSHLVYRITVLWPTPNICERRYLCVRTVTTSAPN